jgi:hypothetical protein
MARPLAELVEKFALIKRVLGDIKLMKQDSDEYKNLQSDEFSKVCLDLTSEAAQVCGSHKNALDEILKLPEGSEAAKGFLMALGSLAGSRVSGSQSALGDVYKLLRQTDKKALADLKAGFSLKDGHSQSKPVEDAWTDNTAGFLALAEPVRLLDYSASALSRNMGVAIDLLKTVQGQGAATKNFDDFVECFKKAFRPTAADFGSSFEIEIGQSIHHYDVERPAEISLSETFEKYPQAWIVDDRKLIQGWFARDEFVYIKLDAQGREDNLRAPGKKVFHSKGAALKAQYDDLKEFVSAAKKELAQAKLELYNELHRDLHGDNAPGL